MFQILAKDELYNRLISAIISTMRGRLRRYYEYLIIAVGLGAPLALFLTERPPLPPLLDLIFLLTVAAIAARYYVSIKNTIVSFEIVIYLFLLLTYGPVIAALTSLFTISLVWFIRGFPSLYRGDQAGFLGSLKMGLYNGGVYSIMYLLVGSLFEPYPTLIRGIFAAFFLVGLNEIFFAFSRFLERYDLKRYFKEEALQSDLIEILIYPLGISMAMLYQAHGFIATLPLIMSILLLSIIGNQMSKYQSRIEMRIQEEEELNEITEELESLLDLDRLIDTALEKVFHFINARKVAIVLESPDHRIFLHKSYDGTRVSEGEEVSSEAIDLNLSTGEKSLGSLRVIPDLPLSRGKMILLENLTKHISLCLANAILYKLSIEDPLTSLFTRRYFEQKLTEGVTQVEKKNGRFSIVLFDIDNFKMINDQLGHRMGDWVLIQFARVLRDGSRKHDIIARWGGDEFVTILPDTGEEEARQYGERIQEVFSNYLFRIKNREIRCSVTFGHFEYHPKSRIHRNEIFHEVDRRLLALKRKKGR